MVTVRQDTASIRSGPPPLVVIVRPVPGDPSFPGCEVRTGADRALSRRELLGLVRGAAVVVTMFSHKVDAEFLDAAGDQLRGVCNFAVGVDNIDLAECARRGVTVTNTPHAVTEGTADMAWALLLAVTRRIVEADRFVRSGAWAERGPLGMTDLLGGDLTGRTLLIVGAGRIGYATATRSLGWGMRVLYTARSRHWEFELAPLAALRVELDEGLALADVVSIHTPLTPQTRHLIDERRLALMKPGAIVINTARGPVIDEPALARALAGGQLGGAGLDVFEQEPDVDSALLTLPNVVLAPHIGSASRRYREMMTAMVCEDAMAILSGRAPRHLA